MPIPEAARVDISAQFARYIEQKNFEEKFKTVDEGLAVLSQARDRAKELLKSLEELATEDFVGERLRARLSPADFADEFPEHYLSRLKMLAIACDGAIADLQMAESDGVMRKPKTAEKVWARELLACVRRHKLPCKVWSHDDEGEGAPIIWLAKELNALLPTRVRMPEAGLGAWRDRLKPKDRKSATA
jgi:hypothetical protein